MKYRKKSVIIEAVLVSDLLEMFNQGWKELPNWVSEAYEKGTINTITDNDFIIKTPEGNIKATRNDYLIKGAKEEIYPCKEDIFDITYEMINKEK